MLLSFRCRSGSTHTQYFMEPKLTAINGAVLTRLRARQSAVIASSVVATPACSAAPLDTPAARTPSPGTPPGTTPPGTPPGTPPPGTPPGAPPLPHFQVDACSGTAPPSTRAVCGRVAAHESVERVESDAAAAFWRCVVCPCVCSRLSVAHCHECRDGAAHPLSAHLKPLHAVSRRPSDPSRACPPPSAFFLSPSPRRLALRPPNAVALSLLSCFATLDAGRLSLVSREFATAVRTASPECSLRAPASRLWRRAAATLMAEMDLSRASTVQRPTRRSSALASLFRGAADQALRSWGPAPKPGARWR